MRVCVGGECSNNVRGVHILLDTHFSLIVQRVKKDSTLTLIGFHATTKMSLWCARWTSSQTYASVTFDQIHTVLVNGTGLFPGTSPQAQACWLQWKLIKTSHRWRQWMLHGNNLVLASLALLSTDPPLQDDSFNKTISKHFTCLRHLSK